jgi:filamentous hemagglutinin family protein
MIKSLNRGIGFQPMNQKSSFINGGRSSHDARTARRPVRIGRARPSIVVAIASLVGFARALSAGIVLDGSFGSSGALPGPNYMISATFGKQVGTNLFQSFSQFNLINTESATFTGPANIHNIVSRVTGGSPSSIDGQINSDIQGANLFFVNPSGVVFGPHAQINTTGSVAISTAQYLKMADGGRFNASLGGNDILTTAPISAFGFLNSAPAGISLTGSNVTSYNEVELGSALNIAAGKVFSIVAGNISIDAAYITGEGARVNLIGVHSAGEVLFDPTDRNSSADVSQFTSLGNVHLTNGTLIDISGDSGGPVFVRGGDVLLDNFSKIKSSTFGDEAGGSITVQGHELAMNNSTISTATGFSFFSTNLGNAGDIKITVDEDFKMTGDSIIAAATSGMGSGGNIAIQARHFSMTPTKSPLGNLVGGSISTATLGRGAAGKINLNAGSILIRKGVVESNNLFGFADAGSIILRTGALKIVDGSVSTGISCPTCGGTTTQANGGNIEIHARDIVDLETAFIDADAREGTGGNITIDPVFIIMKDSLITASAGTGLGGNINLVSDFFLASNNTITATGTIANGTVNITAPSLDLGAELITLPSSLVDAQNQLRERCTALLEGDFSSFISLGRGGTEPEPDELESEF